MVIIGESGAGKSLGIAKPTLKTFNGVICIVDIKGELSNHYKELYDKKLVNRPYLIFDPSDPRSPPYGVFDWIRADSKVNTVANIREIAHALIHEDPKFSDKFWTDSEREVLAAAFIYYYNLGLSFSEAACLVSVSSISETIRKISTSNDRIAQMLLGDIGLLKPEQQAAIGRGIRNALSIFATDPCLGHAFRGESEGAKCFNWEDLDQYNIFLKIPEDRLEQWSFALNLMFTQLLHFLMRRPEKHTAEGKNTVPTLLLMDELASLGKVEILPHAISTLRSKNVSLCLMIQSIAQLDKLYGEYDRRIILDNCPYKAILRANDPETQELLSRLVGTDKHIQYSRNEHFDAFGDTDGYGKQFSETTEWIVPPHLFASLNDILFITPFGTKIVRKFKCHDISGELYTCNKEIPTIKATAISAADFKSDINHLPVKAVVSVLPNPQKFIFKEEIPMKTVEERLEIAETRIAEAERKRVIEDRTKKDLAQSIETRRFFAVGKLVVKYFPDLCKLTPGNNSEETNQNFEPLDEFLRALSQEKDFLRQIAEVHKLSASNE